MIAIALAGPFLALGFLLLMHRLERWLDDSLRSREDIAEPVRSSPPEGVSPRG